MDKRQWWFMVWQLVMAIGIIFCVTGPFSNQEEDHYRQEVERLSRANIEWRELDKEWNAKIIVFKAQADSLQWGIEDEDSIRTQIEVERGWQVWGMDALNRDKLHRFPATLRPKVIAIKGDTFLCFTGPQSLEIAQHLVKSQFSDSLAVSYEYSLGLLEYQAKLKDSTIAALEHRR